MPDGRQEFLIKDSMWLLKINYIHMKSIKYISFLLGLIILLGCEQEILFDTVEAPKPNVSDVDWSASAGGVTTGFAEGGRVFRLPSPLDANNPYRDIRFTVTINSNDQRVIDSLAIEFQHIPSLPSNRAFGWQFYEGIKFEDSERTGSLDLVYDLNLDDLSESYWGEDSFFIGNGASNITREDNVIRIGIFFDDGSSFRLAQVQFSYALTDDGIE